MVEYPMKNCKTENRSENLRPICWHIGFSGESSLAMSARVGEVMEGILDGATGLCEGMPAFVVRGHHTRQG
jgi:hypothetical protein